MAEDRGRAEVDDVDAGSHGADHRGTLVVGPRLVMAERQDRLVLQHGLGVLIDRDVGDVGHVEAMLLGEPDEGVLVREEVRRSVAGVERPVEGCHPGTVADRVRARTQRARSGALVEGEAAVGVPARLGQRASDDQVGRGAGRIPDGQQHVGGLTGRGGQFQQVVTGDEGLGQHDGGGQRPVVAADHVDPRRERAGWLDDAGELRRRPDAAGPRSLVVAHAIGGDRVTRRRRRDVQIDRVPGGGVRDIGESLDDPRLVGGWDLPRCRPDLGVLGDHRPRHHAVRGEERRRHRRLHPVPVVDDLRLAGGRRTPGQQERAQQTRDNDDVTRPTASGWTGVHCSS